MANQKENPVPYKGGDQKRRNSDLIPRFYRTDSNKKFIQATIDQLTQPGVVKKINGYIGRQNAKSSTSKDIFISTVDDTRKNYQLEPGLVVSDDLGNVEFYKDYIDYINQLGVFGAKVDNHERLNRQEFYSWNPHIDWDKFVNFQQYYWLPYGPRPIEVYGQERAISSTYTVTIEDQGNSKEYLFTPNGLTRNPVIKLYRGQTYHFDINSLGEPFSIKTQKVEGPDQRYTWGPDTAYAIESGTLTFTVPDDAPNLLYYVSENDANIGNIFKIYDIKDNTEIDVELEIIGKKSYKLGNGISLSNGMKVKFRGEVTPSKYANDYFYVEGVGSAISLIAERDLEIISNFSSTVEILFDDTPFESNSFEVASSYPKNNDYIVINRASKDRNPWSRYNRWFHKDVIETSATLNGEIASLDQTARAIRPIIEFEAGLKLFNFGLEAIVDIDLLDTVTTDAFSEVEGQLSYAIDAVSLVNGHRVAFAADTDIRVRNKIYRVEFVEVTPPGESRQRQIHLVEESTPVEHQTALIKYGRLKQGLMYWYNGSEWLLGQTKTTNNQTPLFDLVDDTFNSFGDKTVYEGSTFAGTKLFSYSIGDGSADSELGFALDYKNINNVGDILFNFNLLSDTFTYKTIYDVNTISVNTGSLIKSNGISSVAYTNAWEISKVENYQPIIRIYRGSNKTNNFNIDVYDDITDLSDLVVRVYVNGRRLDKSLWSVADGNLYKVVTLVNDITETDVLTIKSFARQSKNSVGYYEIPLNLQNNPLNNEVSQFTLGEVVDHVDSIIDNLSLFSGDFPGTSNIRDLGNVNPYGTKFVQHSGALPLALYHLTSKDNNFIKALTQSQNDYGKFKRQFILTAETLGIDVDTVEFVDAILNEINKNKPKTFPYYFSDMVPYGAAVTTNITVVDYRTKYYPLSSNFNIGELSPKAVLIYVNGLQLSYGIDYTFDGNGFAIINYSNLANDDTITIVEYETTDGCFIPSTPTKLGLWPKYQPKIYLDTTVNIPNGRWMIQGHDGSHVLAYGTYDEGGTPDYRDELLLELELRIFNNIKFNYDTSLFDINDYIPRYVSNSEYSLQEFNEILSPNFYQWTNLVDRDFTKPLTYNKLDPFTYNYTGHTAPDGRETPGYWRAIYKWIYDTDRPHLCPWEMLGFSIMPAWWEEQYGPAPYTSDNLVMWQDISEGVVRDPNAPIFRNTKYLRPFLLGCIPVTSDGLLRTPIESNVADGLITPSSRGDFVFGDGSPVEAAWRRSSYFPFAVISTLLLTYPSAIVGRIFDRSRIYRDLSGQIVYKDTKVRFRLADAVLPNIYSDDTRVQTSGLVNYLIDYIQSDNLKSLTQYKYDLQNLNLQLAYRIGGFTEKEKFNLILDSKNPTASGGVFVPQENYSIVLNTSSPVKKLVYSGVIITKLSTGYEVKGYSKNSPYFYYYPWIQAGYLVNVGGISETYSEWESGQQYVSGKLVKYNSGYYRVTVTHTTSSSFDSTFYQKLPALPIVGGRDAYIRTGWDKTELITVAYGSKFRTIQEVVDFLVGYGEYLKDQGFKFDEFNNNLSTITDWRTAAKEFLFWTTQNWSSGETKWTDWLENQDYVSGEVLQYNGDYYVVKNNINSGVFFNEEQYNKLGELSTIGASVIALSPAATSLIANLPYCVLEDIRDQFNGYEFFKADGEKLEPEFINSFRDDNTIEYTVANTEGIYGATFYLVQKEHILLIDNTTLFNDTIYEQTTGYRQEKIKVSGYISTNWKGGFDIPGFIYDQALIKNWAAWTDYNLGDVVRYKEFYYSANAFLPGVLEFDSNDWIKLKEKPTSRMIPNWSYKAAQFEDFYSLDSDNFDVGQQRMAQHLIGYQKRQYLENIIQDDISEYKFYQGMIIEKGTQNVLNKLFDVLSADNKESIKFFEEWAVRVGQYGSSKAFEQIEFELNDSLFKLNPQPYELVSSTINNSVDFVVRQTPNDVYLKPLNYNSAPWPVNENFTPYLRTPGYVKTDEVDINIDTLDEIISKDITQFSEGSYIHCAFEGRDWNIYRLTKSIFNIQTVSYNKTTKVLTLTTDIIPNISANDIIGILHETSIQGFHKVSSVNLTTITINKEFKDFPDPNTVDPGVLLIFKITTQRASHIDNISSIIPNRLKTDEVIWVDDNGTGKWSVYAHSNVYTEKIIRNPKPSAGLAFGKTIAVTASALTAAVANTRNQIVIFEKATASANWVQKQTVTLLDVATVSLGAFGESLEFSPDGSWLIIGTPTASSVKTQYKGTWSNSTTTYVINDVVRYNGNYYIALRTIPVNTNPASNSTFWGPAPSIKASVNGVASSYTSQGMITLYKKNAAGEFILQSYIVSPTQSSLSTTELFGSKIVFSTNTTMFVSATGHDSSKGRVYQFDYTTVNGVDQWSMNSIVLVGSAANDRYGHDVTASSDGTYLAISAPTKDTSTLSLDTGATYIYSLSNSAYSLTQTLTGLDLNDTEQFGSSISLSSDGHYLAVSSRYADDTFTDQGIVKVFKQTNGVFSTTPYQTLKSRIPEISEQFGTKISFMNNDDTLVIFSVNGDNSNILTFDVDQVGYSTPSGLPTTFDGDTLKVLDKVIDSGRVDVYDKYYSKWVFSESLASFDIPQAGFGTGFAVKKNTVVVSAPNAVDQSIISGKVYSFEKKSNAYSWTRSHEQLPVVNLEKIKKVFLYNKKTNTIVTYLDIIDPLQGNIAGIAEQEIKFKTFYDPATYTVGTDSVNVDDGMAWTDKKVGMLWWDMSRAKFLDYNNGDVVYRNTTWNKLYDTASIDIYEWVESSVLPSAWDKLADTETGLASNISGISLYGDSVYSIKRRYDNVSKTFKNTYYFWVKNKTIVPNVTDRYLSAKNVADLIADPKGQGLQFIAFTGTNSFSLANISQSLIHSDINLAIEYWIVDDYSINSHSQWKIISNDPNSSLPISIEEKLIDSLCGKDSNSRVVPDFSLPPKMRYGIENRPRQSMFINRIEALKQYIERINSVLIKYTIVEDRDISDLDQYEVEPSTVTGLYDTVVDTDAELRFIGTSTFRTAELTPTIENGRITSVTVVTSGQGYINAPYITVTGSGIGAKLRAKLNDNGQIVGATILNSGEGYNESTTVLSIRTFSALVKADTDALGQWSIYAYDTVTRAWSRVRSQNYDVRKYWSYTNWYASGYNQFTLIDFTVDATYQLPALTTQIGQVIKVNSVGTGGWLLLEKYADVNSVDYTQSYKVIGRENGTIQIKDNLYNFFNSNLGFDGPLFDGDIYDNTAAIEVRIILTALRNKILIDDLKQDYLDAFFACVRYAFSEQTFIDWIFKTSFVRAQHNVGQLKQKITYNNDNLSDFESYVTEVKPYRTKIREFVSSYDKLDPAYNMVTDFDLQTTYLNNILMPIETALVDGEILTNLDDVYEYPWRNWYDNAGFKLTSITIIDGGSGYLKAPEVRITGGYGTGATAKAYISQGKVNRIVLLTPGSRYFSVPTITLDGGLALEGGVAAKAIATIGDSVVRSNYIKIKFDRVSGQYYITKLQETETFTTISATQKTFNLKWSPSTDILNSTVTVNGIELIKGTYSLTSKKSVTRGYTSYYGLLTLETAPDKGVDVTITYIKDFNYLSAADRINWYYNPATGEIGKDTSQLMHGVDYGGVQIIGLGFEVTQGWGSTPWFTDAWDSLDPTYEDYSITVGGLESVSGYYEFTLPYTPAVGEEINVYYKVFGTERFFRIDSTPYTTVSITEDGGVSSTENFLDIIEGGDSAYVIDGTLDAGDADNPITTTTIIATFIGNGITKKILISDTLLTPNPGDTFIFRKSTSDGSIKPQDTDYDTSLSGGNLAYSTATGLAADDIIIDGDEFVNATTSHGPEEVVPGQIVDTVAVKVTTRPSSGAANIDYNNYVFDGVTTAFTFDQPLSYKQAVMVLVSGPAKDTPTANALRYDPKPLVIDVDFTVDYANKQVILITEPPVGSMISIITFGFSGANLLEIDYFVSDGTSNEFITNASWGTGVSGLIYLNGETVSYELFETDTSYEIVGLVGIRFAIIPPVDSIINYVLASSTVDNFSLMKSEKFTADGDSVTYLLSNVVGTSLPLEQNMLVYASSEDDAAPLVYTSPTSTYYTIENDQYEYYIPKNRFVPYEPDVNQISVFANNKKLKIGSDYTVDLSKISIKLKNRAYHEYEGDQLTISVNRYSTYTCDGSSITFAEAPADGTVINVISFYKHESMEIQRTDINVLVNSTLTPDTFEYYTYHQPFGKIIKLDRSVVNDSRVWLIKNGRILQSSIDYRLNANLSSVTLAKEPLEGDKFTVMTFGSNVVQQSFSFMQFKDMLNRFHYKRLRKSRQTTLKNDLHFYDTEIVINDDRVVSLPNRDLNLPGIIEIRGERIEYFLKTGNVLSQLRRGTLGTGVREVYNAGTVVQDIGITETIPYKDDTIVEQIIADGTSYNYTLETAIPGGFTTAHKYKGANLTSTDAALLPKSAVEVFAGGWIVKGPWATGITYLVNELVTYGSYTYKCLASHTSSEFFADLEYVDEITGIAEPRWQFFIGNIRLKKDSYEVHNSYLHNESPEGDITFDADFTVSNSSNVINLTDLISENVALTVIKRTGKIWEDNGSSLAESNNAISKFIKFDLELINNITDQDGEILADENGNPLEL